MAATQMIIRQRRKDGGTELVSVVSSTCYEFIVCCSMILDEDMSTYKMNRSYCAAMTRLVEPRKQEYERIRRHHKAFKANTWNPDGLDPEPRVCLILNRFSRNLGVMYASPSCESILHIDSDEITGKPFLVFVRADDLASFVEQTDVAKASNMITHMRLWFQSPYWPQEIPCEAMVLGSSDGLLLVMRRCSAFTRRRLITGMCFSKSHDHSVTSSVDSGSSECTCLSAASSFSPPPASPSQGMNGRHMTIIKTPQEMAEGSISRIVEQSDDSDLKPMTSLEPDGFCRNEGSSPRPRESYFYRPHHVQASNDEVMWEEMDELDLGMDQLK
ncbi:hypothetical protein BGZ72_003808 [Mortierella alpina]|nr:hypothetical protein BGZ72_003808 [Mortierella alpina]